LNGSRAMTLELLLFCLFATMVTFSFVIMCAVATSVAKERSYKIGNWGSYSRYDQKADIDIRDPIPVLAKTGRGEIDD
jgi:spermidine/putrescine-binding protein